MARPKIVLPEINLADVFTDGQMRVPAGAHKSQLEAIWRIQAQRDKLAKARETLENCEAQCEDFSQTLAKLNLSGDWLNVSTTAKRKAKHNK